MEREAASPQPQARPRATPITRLRFVPVELGCPHVGLSVWPLACMHSRVRCYLLERFSACITRAAGAWGAGRGGSGIAPAAFQQEVRAPCASAPTAAPRMSRAALLLPLRHRPSGVNLHTCCHRRAAEPPATRASCPRPYSLCSHHNTVALLTSLPHPPSHHGHLPDCRRVDILAVWLFKLPLQVCDGSVGVHRHTHPVPRAGALKLFRVHRDTGERSDDDDASHEASEICVAGPLFVSASR